MKRWFPRRRHARFGRPMDSVLKSFPGLWALQDALESPVVRATGAQETELGA